MGDIQLPKKPSCFTDCLQEYIASEEFNSNQNPSLSQFVAQKDKLSYPFFLFIAAMYPIQIKRGCTRRQGLEALVQM